MVFYEGYNGEHYFLKPFQQFKNVNRKKIKDGLTLPHIHQYYGQWRIDHKLPVNMRLR